MAIIFISHKLNEVLDIADRVTVLRRGKKIETVPTAGATREGLAQLMVGREVLLRVEKTPAQPGGAASDGREPVTVLDDRGLQAVRDVSFEVRAGEIVGIAGVDGNGQTELIDALTGLRRTESGRVVVAAKDVTNDSAREALDAGLGHIPEDRHRRGLVLDFTLAENIALHDYREPPDSRFGWLYPEPADRARPAAPRRSSTCAAAGPVDAGVGAVGRQPAEGRRRPRGSARSPRPARGAADARAGRGRDRVRPPPARSRSVTRGGPMMLVSLELEEILSLSDRILVMYEGRIVGEYGPDVTRRGARDRDDRRRGAAGRVSEAPRSPTPPPVTPPATERTAQRRRRGWRSTSAPAASSRRS